MVSVASVHSTTSQDLVMLGLGTTAEGVKLEIYLGTCLVLSSLRRFVYVCLLLLYTIAKVFQLYLGDDMMYEMRGKPEPTLLPTQGIFSLPYHIGMVWEQLAFDDTISSGENPNCQR